MSKADRIALAREAAPLRQNVEGLRIYQEKVAIAMRPGVVMTTREVSNASGVRNVRRALGQLAARGLVVQTFKGASATMSKWMRVSEWATP